MKKNTNELRKNFNDKIVFLETLVNLAKISPLHSAARKECIF